MGTATKKATFRGFVLGGATFVAVSYIAHCKFGLGPWGCQRSDPRYAGSGLIPNPSTSKGAMRRAMRGT